MKDVKLAPQPDVFILWAEGVEKRGKRRKNSSWLIHEKNLVWTKGWRASDARLSSVVIWRGMIFRLIKVSIKICRKDIPVLVFMRHSILFVWISSWSWMWCYMTSINPFPASCRYFITHVTSYFQIVMEIMERKLFPYSFTRCWMSF